MKTSYRYCCLKHKKSNLPAGLEKTRFALLLTNGSKWVNGTNLSYYFFEVGAGSYVKNEDGTTTWKRWNGSAKEKEKVRLGFKKWEALGIGLSFTEVKSREEADIRIGFMKGDGCWSCVGRESWSVSRNQRTMNFGWDITTTSRANGIDTILHEIGHAIGFQHEHQNPEGGIVWDEKAVYENLFGDPNFWSKTDIRDNVLTPLNINDVEGSGWDPDSIMHYPFEPKLIKKPEKYYLKGLTPKGGFSSRDIATVKKIYPKKPGRKLEKLKLMDTYTLALENAEQKDFSFTPLENRNYTIQTFGKLDAVVVVMEKTTNNSLVYLTADDNSGTDKNAMINVSLKKGKTYLIKVRVFYRKAKDPSVIMIW
ncbi:MAG: hypothetical protein K0S26_1099 [Bacteroidota bacterium]|jgi:hypothetical protein|nr:hypothetical protein [Bacteroidota bacterium]